MWLDVVAFNAVHADIIAQSVSQNRNNTDGKQV